MISPVAVSHVVGSMDVRVGGVARFISDLIPCLADQNTTSDLYTFGYPVKDHWSGASVLDHVRYYETFSGALGISFNAISSLRENFKKCHVVHNHGLWIWANYCAVACSNLVSQKIIFSTHGLLEPWALRHHLFRKKIFWNLWQRRHLSLAAAIHATSLQEHESLRSLGVKNPIAVIPIGITAGARSLEAQSTAGRKTLLFLSRIDSKKGLERLFLIWKKHIQRFLGWELIIAGDGARSYVDGLKRKAAELGIQDRIHWVGFVQGEEKTKLFKQASIYILPTFSENFGIAIGEALAQGVPVITTNGTPWSDLASERCGWYAENNELAIEQAMLSAMATPPTILKEMGERGRALIERKYAWPEIAKKMADTYRWMLKMGDRPDCVRLD